MTPDDPWAAYPRVEDPAAVRRPAQPAASAPVPAEDPWAAYPPVEEPGFLARQAQRVKEFGGRVANFVTGDDRTEFEGVPEFIQMMDRIELSPAQRDTLRTGLAVSQDEGQIQDIIAKNLPGATFTADRFGNPIVEYQGERAYVNKPGLSRQDVAAGATFGSLAAATGGLASGSAGGAALVRPITTLGRMAFGGTVAGGTSAAEDLAAHAAGADKVIDPHRVGWTAVLGAAAETLAPAVRGLYRTIFRRPELFNAQTGQLTPAGIRALQRAGATPDQISDDLAREFARLADDAASPEDALRLAQGRSLPVPVDQTRGQLTGSPSQQMTEDMLLKGAYGEDASNQMRRIVAGQQEQMRQNIPAIQQRLGAQPIDRGQGAAAAQAALATKREAAEQAVDLAYDAARASSAELPRAAVQNGARAISNAVQEEHILTGLPRTQAVLGQLDDMLLKAGDDPMAGVDVRALFDWRKRATSAAQAGGEESVAIRKAISAFDNWVSGNIDDALLRGDEAAVNLWREAIRQRRELGSAFQGGDLIEALTQTTRRGGQRVLAVAPEDAANYIFGAAKSGLFPKANLARDLARMKGMLGADSEAWRALKQEAFLRFAAAGEGAFEGGAQQFSGAGFRRAWQDAWRRSPEMMKNLFSDADKQLIDQFAEVAARVTNPARGGANFSNTTPAALNAIQNLWRWLVSGPKGAAVLTRFPGVGYFMEGARARQAIATGRQVIPRLDPPPGTVGGPLTQPVRGFTNWMLGVDADRDR